jgi:hypothetical protein
MQRIKVVRVKEFPVKVSGRTHRRLFELKSLTGKSIDAIIWERVK